MRLFDSLGRASALALAQKLDASEEVLAGSPETVDAFLGDQSAETLVAALSALCLETPSAHPRAPAIIRDLVGRTAALHPRALEAKFLEKAGFGADGRILNGRESIIGQVDEHMQRIAALIEPGSRTEDIKSALTNLCRRGLGGFAQARSTLTRQIQELEWYRGIKYVPARQAELTEAIAVLESIVSVFAALHKQADAAGESEIEETKAQRLALELSEEWSDWRSHAACTMALAEGLRAASVGSTEGLFDVIASFFKRLAPKLLGQREVEVLKDGLKRLIEEAGQSAPELKALEPLLETLDAAAFSKPKRPFTLPPDAPRPIISEAEDLIAEAEGRAAAELASLAGQSDAPITWSGLELLERSSQRKKAVLSADGVKLTYEWIKKDDQWVLGDRVEVGIRGEDASREAAMTAPVADAIVLATLSLGEVASVSWRNGRVTKVQLDEGGTAFLRTPRTQAGYFNDGPKKDLAVWLMVQAAESKEATPTVLLDDAGQLSITADRPGLRMLYVQGPTPGMTRSGGEAPELKSAFDRLDVWHFVANDLDASPYNTGVDHEPNAVGVDWEASFSRGAGAFEQRHYYRSWTRSFELAPDLRKVFESWSREDLRRITEPAGLQEEAIDWAHDRIQLLLHLSAKHGRLPRSELTSDALAKFLRGQR